METYIVAIVATITIGATLLLSKYWLAKRRTRPFPSLVLDDESPRKQEHGTSIAALKLRFGPNIYVEDEDGVEYNRPEFVLEDGKTYSLWYQVQ